MEIHLGAGEILMQPRLAVFRGEGGEAERRPNKPCEVWSLTGGKRQIERWAALLPEPRQGPDEDLDLTRLTAVWNGASDDYAEASVIGTTAVALRLMGWADGMPSAEQMAAALWRERDAKLTAG
jgi:anthranilate phosphoribosyltransferase